MFYFVFKLLSSTLKELEDSVNILVLLSDRIEALLCSFTAQFYSLDPAFHLVAFGCTEVKLLLSSINLIFSNVLLQ